nr:2731_t:CDS:1 [Entrophospora candida]
MESQVNTQEHLHKKTNENLSRMKLLTNYFRSTIFQGVVLGWIVFISTLISAIFAGMWCHMTDFNVIWDLRIGLYLTVITVITKITSVVVGFMVPAILAGIFAFSKTLSLNGSGTTISQLMEASMSRGLLSTIKACFNSGQTRKPAIIVASVLIWQYAASAADLYVHVTAIGSTQQLPGLIIPSTRSIDIANDCSETDINSCGQNKRTTSNHIRALEIYQNMSDTLRVWRSDGGVYLLQSPPPEQAYAYSGSGLFLQPSCEPISSICNLKARYGSRTDYTCPETLWSASGNTVTELSVVNVTTNNYDLAAGKYIASNPIHAIVTIRYPKDISATYDSEFVTEVHGDLSILLHCQILVSTTEYVITLGSLKAKPLGNLTNPQLVVLSRASTRGMFLRAVDDTDYIASKGDSKLFANEFALQWAHATVSSFNSAVEENGNGYDYTLEVIKDQTIVPLPAVLLYVIIIIFPLLIFSCVCLYSLRNSWSGVYINWILAEFLCTPQRLLYQSLIEKHCIEDACLESLAVQEMRIRKVKCSIGVMKEHFELTADIEQFN